MYPASGVSFDRKIEGDSAARRVLAIKFLSALHDGAFKSQSQVFMELKLLRSSSLLVFGVFGEILSVKDAGKCE